MSKYALGLAIPIPTATRSPARPTRAPANWTLTVTDSFGGDVGTLATWCVTIAWQ